MNDRAHLITEQRLAESMELDSMSLDEAVALMNREDAKALRGFSEKANVIAAIELVVAGSGWRAADLCGGGPVGGWGCWMHRSARRRFAFRGNGAGDYRRRGRRDVSGSGRAETKAEGWGGGDHAKRVTGIGSWHRDGSTTPFVRGAAAGAGGGAKTVFLSVCRRCRGAGVDVVIRPLTGPEVVTGSTRLKAGRRRSDP